MPFTAETIQHIAAWCDANTNSIPFQFDETERGSWEQRFRPLGDASPADQAFVSPLSMSELRSLLKASFFLHIPRLGDLAAKGLAQKGLAGFDGRYFHGTPGLFGLGQEDFFRADAAVVLAQFLVIEGDIRGIELMWNAELNAILEEDLVAKRDGRRTSEIEASSSWL